MVEVGERYRHFKGKEYEVVSVGWDCENLKRVVVYRGDYNDDRFGMNPVWVRDYDDFIGLKEIDGKEARRFEKFGSVSGKVGVKVKRLREDAVLPRYGREGDAAMDIVAVSKKVCENYIEYGTGLAFEVPEGYAMLMFPRSSATKNDLIMGNCVGILDSGYRGELIVRFNVIGDRNHYEVGDRIVQVMILPYPAVEFEEVDSLSESVRGEGRFGSTGR